MELESPAVFAKRVGINDKLIRQYVKQGKLPYIKTGKSHVKIHVAGALEAIKAMAETTATDQAALMPVIPKTVTIPNIPYKHELGKYRGRPPDKVRLAKH